MDSRAIQSKSNNDKPPPLPPPWIDGARRNILSPFVSLRLTSKIALSLSLSLWLNGISFLSLFFRFFFLFTCHERLVLGDIPPASIRAGAERSVLLCMDHYE